MREKGRDSPNKEFVGKSGIRMGGVECDWCMKRYGFTEEKCPNCQHPNYTLVPGYWGQNNFNDQFEFQYE